MARQKLVHLHTGDNRAPSASVLNYGEIAVMHNEDAPSLFIKAGENEATKVAQFIDKVQTEALIDQKISASTEDLIALKSEVLTEQGRINSLDSAVITAMTINGATATTESPQGEGAVGKIASVTIDTDDINVGANITYSGETFIGTSASTTTALQTLATKIESIDGVISESSHGHDNKAVLDGITSQKVSDWDSASTAVWGKVDAVEGKVLSSNDYTDGEKEKLTGVESGAQVNVLESVKVNGTALTITDKAVDIELGSAAFSSADDFDEAGAANTVKTDLIGDMTGDTKTLGALQDAIEGLTTGQSVTMTAYTNGDTGLTEGYLKSYEFFQGGTSIGKVDIPKDLVVTSGQVTLDDQSKKVLRLTIANQAAPVDILVSDLAHVYTEGNGIEISSADVISVKVVAANGLSVDANGIAMAAASANGAGAMSASDFEKLAGIASGAQVNTIEGVQVNGSDLTPDSSTKKVNVTITTGSTAGTISVNGSDVAVTGLGSAAFENTTAFDAAGAAAAASAASYDSATSYTDAAIQALNLGDDNVIEGVQVNGSDLTADQNKKVNVTITGGTANGTIAVNGTDVAVTGLGSAAYADTTAFDAAGAAGSASAAAVSTVVGTAQDNSGATTIYGAKAYADQKASEAQAAAEAAVVGTAQDNSGATTVYGAKAYADQVAANAQATAEGAVQGIAENKDSGVVLDSNNDLDFTGLGIDCGTY